MLETNTLNRFWLGHSGGHVTNHTVGAYSCLMEGVKGHSGGHVTLHTVGAYLCLMEGGKQVVMLPFAAQ